MTAYTLSELRSFLVERYDQLKSRLTHRLGGEEQAGDALHDAWLRLHSGAIAEPVNNPQAFVLRMAVNTAVDRWRKDSRLISDTDVEALLALDDPELGPRHSLEAQFEMHRLLQVLDELPARRRQIFLAVRIDGESQQELASRYGISRRAIEAEVRRAHDYCAQRLERDGREPTA